METKFTHSVKVPNQFRKAAKLLKSSMVEHKSLKTQIFNEKHAKTNRLYALISKISKNKGTLDRLIEKSEILEKEKRLDKYMCYVLMTELLFGSKNLPGESKPVQCVLSYKDRFDEILANKEDIAGATQSDQSDVKPRYVRVNTLLMPRSEALEWFKTNGWNEIPCEFENYDDFLIAIDKLDKYDYISDLHVKNLFIFPPSSKRYWALNELVKQSKLILQDKASCLPSNFLNPPRGSFVLDMCAAPGMKTTHLAAIMKNRGKIWAVERDRMRYSTLVKTAQTTNSTIVETIREDVLLIDPSTMSKVQYILLDPPCSGSGMTNRLGFSTNDTNDQAETDRLWSLGGLQIKMLVHTLTKFPNAVRIVYSTCSISDSENEHVVYRAIESIGETDWELKKPIEFAEKWKNFGNKAYKHIGKKCIYAKTEIDKTDGFFVAIFERNLE